MRFWPGSSPWVPPCTSVVAPLGPRQDALAVAETTPASFSYGKAARQNQLMNLACPGSTSRRPRANAPLQRPWSARRPSASQAKAPAWARVLRRRHGHREGLAPIPARQPLFAPSDLVMPRRLSPTHFVSLDRLWKLAVHADPMVKPDAIRMPEHHGRSRPMASARRQFGQRKTLPPGHLPGTPMSGVLGGKPCTHFCNLPGAPAACPRGHGKKVAPRRSSS